MSDNQALATIEQTVKSQMVMNNIRMALGGEADQAAAMAFAAGILNEIRRTAGQEYGDLTVCSPDSIVHAMIDAAKFKVPIDGRKLAHLEIRYNKNRKCQEATLMIDTNGFVFKIAEAYPDFQVEDVAVFEGDEYEVTITDGVADHKYKSLNPFQGPEKLLGIAVKMSYTDHGRKVQTIEMVSKADLLAMQKMGKGNAWGNWPLERMKTAAIKRASKWHFRKVTGLRELIDYDNDKNFNLKPEKKSIAGDIVKNLNNALASPEVTDPRANQTTIDQEPKQ